METWNVNFTVTSFVDIYFKYETKYILKAMIRLHIYMYVLKWNAFLWIPLRQRQQSNFENRTLDTALLKASWYQKIKTNLIDVIHIIWYFLLYRYSNAFYISNTSWDYQKISYTSWKQPPKIVMLILHSMTYKLIWCIKYCLTKHAYSQVFWLLNGLCEVVVNKEIKGLVQRSVKSCSQRKNYNKLTTFDRNSYEESTRMINISL